VQFIKAEKQKVSSYTGEYFNFFSFAKVIWSGGGTEGEVVQTVDTHVSKCKNIKIFLKSNLEKKVLVQSFFPILYSFGNRFPEVE
jgi:hypothetical protein